jgi:hypothetical protein
VLRRSPKPAELRRQLLEPLASQAGVDYDMETLRPGNSPAQLAYGFVSCGADLLLGYSYADGVPSLSRGTRRRVAKAVAGGFASTNARHAAVLLAQALGTYLYEVLHRAGHDTDAHHHLRFRGLVQEHFPLPEELVERLESARAEYRTFETHEVRREIRVGIEGGTGYHMALLDPAFLDGRDPDSDERMVEAQQRYAGVFLRGQARLTAIELTIGPAVYASVSDHLLAPGRLLGAESFVHEASEQALWSNVADDWREHAQRAVGNALPAGQERLPSLDDPIAMALADAVAQLLDDGPAEPVDTRSREALGHFADDMTDAEVDWNAAVDALVTGYYLRYVEREIVEFKLLDPDTAANLRDWNTREPDLALAGGAVTVADSLPRAFASGPEIWEQLRDWAAEQTLARSWARHHAGTDNGDGPSLTVDDCARAFALGYGVRFAEETLA